MYTASSGTFWSVVRTATGCITPLISAIGVSFLLQNIGLLWGYLRFPALNGVMGSNAVAPKSYPQLIPNTNLLEGLGEQFRVRFTLKDLVVLVVSVSLLVALYLFVQRTKIGKAMRAVGMNPRAAQIVGIRLSRIRMLVWAMSGLISALAALLITPKVLITPDIAHIAILAYAAAIVGGFTSLPGAVLGGLIIGVVENLVGLFVSTNAIAVAPFLAILVTLVVRPQGLLGGKVQVKKV